MSQQLIARIQTKCWIILLCICTSTLAGARPKSFVDLAEVAPSIRQDIRYFGVHNFIGRRVEGYHAAKCLLTRPAAEALARIQKQLLKHNLSLKVYDCYRPQRAVNDFIAWRLDPRDVTTKAEFYPNLTKPALFKNGYVAKRSGHSRGSTVDLTLVPVPTPDSAPYQPGQTLQPCFAPRNQRFRDNSIDMGTGYDCMDKRAHPFSQQITQTAQLNRLRLRRIMLKNGFKPLRTEWWHFTLRREPYPAHYFDFEIQ